MPSPTSWSNATYVTLSGSQTIDALLGDTQWVSPSLTYSFPGVAAAWSTDIITGYGPSSSGTEPWNISFAPLSASNQSYFTAALQQWANVANLQFSLVADTSTSVGDIRAAFSYMSSFANAQAWSTTPGATSTAGDVWFNSIGSSAIDSWGPGSFSFYTALHEMGHVLGFKHPFYEPGATVAILPASLDTGQYTVMSYTNPPNDLFRTITYNANGSLTLQSDHVSPETPMVLDIAAMQYLYGANTTYHTGNDVYSFDTVTPFYRTIWDAGGTDTISVSNFSQACVIDLTPGNYSSIRILSEPIPTGYTVIGGTAPTYDGTNNLGIAYGAVIENAIGGSGNDMLSGNDANNSFDGGAGNDTLYGGLGFDTAGFGGNRSAYSITRNSNGSVTVTGTDGTDTLTNIERLTFTDGSQMLGNTSRDYSGDGKSDILWRNSAGDVAMWLMDGASMASGPMVGALPAGWSIMDGAGDYSGDGKSDILLQHSSGALAMWMMDGASIASGPMVGALPAGWSIADGAGDYSGDGKSDILLQHSSGALAMWMMDGASITSGPMVGALPAGWNIMDGAGDYSGDGKSDILLQHSSGALAMWMMDGASIASGPMVGAVSTDWSIQA